MSNPTPPSSLIGIAGDIGRAVSSLPPGFLILCLINVGFLWLVLSFVEHQLDQRNALVKTIVEQCALAKPPKGSEP